MKILWLCNIMLPAIARQLGVPHSNREGWLSGLYSQFTADVDNGMQLAVCFPYASPDRFTVGKTACYGFRTDIEAPEKYDHTLEPYFRDTLADFQPDIVHIFGSEFPHALAMARACDKPERILLGMQGLCGKIAEAYTEGLPAEVVADGTFRDLVKQDSIRQQQEKFAKRAKNERELFAHVSHVAGRTEFDRAAAAELNGKATYHYLGENMRDSFYQGHWEAERCEPYSIFQSQGDYPIKGLHYMLEAMPEILYRFPEAHLYVAGANIMSSKLKLPAYGKYLQGLIHEYGLEDKVTMLGNLSEARMKAQFLKSSVFVCPSAVENSPNAMAEAMLLGVPVVAAAVGGIPSFIRDGKTGLLYEPGNITDLAAAVQIAWDRETACEISAAAAEQAHRVHNRERNYMRLLDIYKWEMV
jgi:glycosyltransferase involved in cell wall biosynthesis